MAASPAPDPGLVRLALAAAAARLAAAHRADPRFAGHSPAALAERWPVVATLPRQAGGGWWEIGAVPGKGRDWRVFMHPGIRRARVRVATPLPPPPDPPPTGGRYYDGCRLQWIDPAAG